MPEVSLDIGGRNFVVACQDGEERQLMTAAAALNEEAELLQRAIGRVPEPRMLLMAGLMLADKTSGAQQELANRDARIRTLEEQLKQVEAKAAQIAASALQVQDDTGSEELETARAEAARAKADAEQALYALERVAQNVERLAGNA